MSVDLTGKIFGKLTVVGKAGKKFMDGWLCECECGGQTVLLNTALVTGNTKSCGCRKKFPPGEADFNSFYAKHMYQLRKRGLENNLSKEEVKGIVTQDCYYCGAPPSCNHKVGDYNGGFARNGMDRVDNLKGYIHGNVVSCCGECNRGKFTMTVEEFKEWSIRLYNNFGSKKD